MIYLVLVFTAILFLTKNSVSGALFGEECVGEASRAFIENNYDVNYTKLCSIEMNLMCDSTIRPQRCTCKEDHFPDFITGDNPDGSVCRFVDVDPYVLEELEGSGDDDDDDDDDDEDPDPDDYDFEESSAQMGQSKFWYSTGLFGLGLVAWIIVS